MTTNEESLPSSNIINDHTFHKVLQRNTNDDTSKSTSNSSPSPGQDKWTYLSTKDSTLNSSTNTCCCSEDCFRDHFSVFICYSLNCFNDSNRYLKDYSQISCVVFHKITNLCNLETFPSKVSHFRALSYWSGSICSFRYCCDSLNSICHSDIGSIQSLDSFFACEEYLWPSISDLVQSYNFVGGIKACD